MAQYYTDFGDETAGTISSKFTKLALSSGAVVTTAVEANVVDIAGDTGKTIDFFLSGETDQAGHYFNPVAGSVPDGEVYQRFQQDRAFDSNHIFAVFGANFRLEGVMFQLRAANLRVVKREGVNDTSVNETELASFSNTLSDGVWYEGRFRYYSGVAQARIWPSTDAEPVTWDVEVTVGAVAYYEPEENELAITAGVPRRFFRLDKVGVGTGGDSAPSSAPATGPETPINPSITDLLATSARLNWEQG